jgi:hypothetical protein
MKATNAQPIFVNNGHQISHPISLDAVFRSVSMDREETLEDAILLTPESGVELNTPTSPNTMYQPHVYQEDIVTDNQTIRDYPGDQSQKSLDHTTVFIGGMEMFGPNAWDEARVRAVFGKFGEIEGVKFIRPGKIKTYFGRYKL